MKKALRALTPITSIIFSLSLLGTYVSAVLGYANLALAYGLISIASFFFLIACAMSDTLSGVSGKERHRDQ